MSFGLHLKLKKFKKKNRQKGMVMKVNSFASIIAIVGVTLGLSAFDVKAQGYSGTGNNFGSGWRRR